MKDWSWSLNPVCTSQVCLNSSLEQVRHCLFKLLPKAPLLKVWTVVFIPLQQPQLHYPVVSPGSLRAHWLMNSALHHPVSAWSLFTSWFEPVQSCTVLPSPTPRLLQLGDGGVEARPSWPLNAVALWQRARSAWLRLVVAKVSESVSTHLLLLRLTLHFKKLLWRDSG